MPSSNFFSSSLCFLFPWHSDDTNIRSFTIVLFLILYPSFFSWFSSLFRLDTFYCSIFKFKFFLLFFSSFCWIYPWFWLLYFWFLDFYLVLLLYLLFLYWDFPSLVAQTVKYLIAVQEPWFRSLGQEDLPEKEMEVHSSNLAWEITWTEEPGGLQSMGSQRVGQDWATDTFTLSFFCELFCLFVSSMFVSVHWNIFMFSLKFLSDISNICVMLALVSVDCLFPFHLKPFWVLVWWMMVDWNFNILTIMLQDSGSI